MIKTKTIQQRLDAANERVDRWQWIKQVVEAAPKSKHTQPAVAACLSNIEAAEKSLKSIKAEAWARLLVREANAVIAKRKFRCPKCDRLVIDVSVYFEGDTARLVHSQKPVKGSMFYERVSCEVTKTWLAEKVGVPV